MIHIMILFEKKSKNWLIFFPGVEKHIITIIYDAFGINLSRSN